MNLVQNPVLYKELRTRMRGRRAFVVLTLYLAIVTLIIALAYLAFRTTLSSPGGGNERQSFGKVFFGLIVWIELVTLSFVAPALTAGAITNERERQTFDLLRITLLRTWELVTGKFLSAFLYLLLLLVSAIPLQSLAFLFGGIAPEEVAIASILLIVTAFAFCAVGVFFSSFVQRTIVSNVLSYAFAILLVFGLPMFFSFSLGFFGVIFSNLNSPANNFFLEILIITVGFILVFTNPIATIVATEIILLDQQNVFWFTFTLSNGNKMSLLSPWIPYTCFYLLESLLLLAISAIIVRRPQR